MSNLLKVVLGVIVVGVVVFIATSYKPESEIRVGLVSNINTPGAFVQDVVLFATSTDRATSTSVNIQNAERLTCYFGTNVDQGGQIIYSAQVSLYEEAAQTSEIHSTSTPLFIPSPTANGFFVVETIVASSTGTSTASIDLDKNIYPFFRIIADNQGTADVVDHNIATSTVECISSY